MADKTGIEWTDATWNPVRGCSRVSEGCRNCYAEGVAHRFSGPGQAYAGLTSVVNGRPAWSGTIQFIEEHLLDPLRWKRPRRIFVNSMSDLFHENVTDEMRDRIFAVMALCPRHTFQVLTKRPERMLGYLGMHNADIVIWARMSDHGIGLGCAKPAWPLPNVWLGVSVENQEAADKRLGTLAMLGRMGWRTMVSFEPLLGAVMALPVWLALGPETWAICGGESGPGARPMHPDWARGLRDQCVAAGVPFFFKQWGEWEGFCTSKVEETMKRHPDLPKTTPVILVKKDGRTITNYCMKDGPGHEMVRVGKKAAGHLLDGKEWHQFPEVAR